MKYYIIAGEASGDLHSSNLMRELKVLDQDANFRCWGGDLMEEQGAVLVKHYRELAFMGFKDVIANLNTIRKNLDLCKKDLLEYKPDILILVDYPGFNLRIAEFAKKNNIRTVYYISPQVWAWKKSRVKKIRKYVDQMLVILPFEKGFYHKLNYEVAFVGHPLLDVVNKRETSDRQKFLKQNQLDNKPIIAVLPGSRKQEISRMMKIMLSVVPHFKDLQFVIAGAPGITPEYYQTILGDSDVKLIHAQTYQLLDHSKAAVVTSGTATLETALFNVPEVICYKGDTISVFIARQLIKIKYISLVNLIMDKEVVKELIQNDFNTKNLKEELSKIVYDDAYRSNMIKQFAKLKILLGKEGASRNAALQIYAPHKVSD
jgi:lipid-A-disaccharide synthase